MRGARHRAGPALRALLALPPALADRRARRVGLLGGSFNPAHRGHLHVSLEALKRLRLDEIWWMVAPQNPLKPVKGMASFAERLAGALKLVRHPRIRVTDIEAQLGTRYTADTLAALRRRFPRTRFLWLMGADNLTQIRRWDRWEDIFRTVPVAVFDRPTYCLRALSELAAQRFKRSRVAPGSMRRLADRTPPAWAFFPIRLDPSSATALRARRRKAAATTTR
ncbi:MAG TPA: nicotinate-nucleotide adenylyltransferase [Stellaceae bacterium]|nr:nicotinate-nucleotide adenylyltransferase [Stellaceae bacterium]